VSLSDRTGREKKTEALGRRRGRASAPGRPADDSLSGAAFRGFLTDGTRALGLELPPGAVDTLDAYRRLLQTETAAHNLTALRTDYAVAVLHVIDSLTLLRTGLFDSGGRCVDIGSGAGLPGIPLKVVRPRLRMTFVESSGKKAGFIARAVRRLGLSECSILAERAESLGRREDSREGFQLAVTRAVAATPVVLEYAVPLLAVGGAFVAMKGPKALEEQHAASRAAAALGARLERLVELDLPLAGQARALLVFRKEAPTPDAYPRRPGVPAKRPLA